MRRRIRIRYIHSYVPPMEIPHSKTEMHFGQDLCETCVKAFSSHRFLQRTASAIYDRCRCSHTPNDCEKFRFSMSSVAASTASDVFFVICCSLRRLRYTKILYISSSWVNWHCIRYVHIVFDLDSFATKYERDCERHCVTEWQMMRGNAKTESDAAKQQVCNQYSIFAWCVDMFS